MSKRIVIAGAQFGDPGILMKWVCQTFDVRARGVELGAHDRIYEAETSDARVIAAVPAHMEPERVYEQLFSEPVDAMLLVLTSIKRLMDCNTKALGWLRPHLSKIESVPIVLANDVHGKNPKFPTATASEVARRLQLKWPVHETTIGNFDDTPKLRWTNGAAGAWDSVVRVARASSSP